MTEAVRSRKPAESAWAPMPPDDSHIFSRGALYTESDIHHHQRRILLSALHRDHVTRYAELIATRFAAAPRRSPWPAHDAPAQSPYVHDGGENGGAHLNREY